MTCEPNIRLWAEFHSFVVPMREYRFRRFCCRLVSFAVAVFSFRFVLAIRVMVFSLSFFNFQLGFVVIQLGFSAWHRNQSSVRSPWYWRSLVRCGCYFGRKVPSDLCTMEFVEGCFSISPLIAISAESLDLGERLVPVNSNT